MATQPPGCAYAICSVRDIPNRRGKGFHLLRRPPDGTETPWHILVVRWDRKLYGYVNVCPHQASIWIGNATSSSIRTACA